MIVWPLNKGVLNIRKFIVTPPPPKEKGSKKTITLVYLGQPKMN